MQTHTLGKIRASSAQSVRGSAARQSQICYLTRTDAPGTADSPRRRPLRHHEGEVIAPNHNDLRIDLAMRQFIGDILRYLADGGDHANARMNMIERGVPLDVQQRVLDGKATYH